MDKQPPNAAHITLVQDSLAHHEVARQAVGALHQHDAHAFGAAAGDHGAAVAVAAVPAGVQSPSERSEAELEPAYRLDAADCVILIRETFAVVDADYVDGALSLLDEDTDLWRRFHDTEAAIDAAAKGGPTAAQFCGALTAHVAVIRECTERKRARREHQAQRVDSARLGNNIIGELWVVANSEALAEHSEILASDLPVVFADELTALAGKSVDELRAIATTKRAFPSSGIARSMQAELPELPVNTVAAVGVSFGTGTYLGRDPQEAPPMTLQTPNRGEAYIPRPCAGKHHGRIKQGGQP